ncbi:hypothetical protein [Nostoc sp. NOS(2021)]|uniref:type II toxin-antitoxin system VapC family toxin n=1 Tax=Nostoc sp. NOS(2021) TaxID=2815407 RepID=UPI0025E89AA2|nr:hypothetical protein [Nostoc sp. NOS(2021)]
MAKRDAIAVHQRLRSQRVRLSTMDLRIVALAQPPGGIAISRNLVLLTRNVSDFSKVPGLVREDWTV